MAGFFDVREKLSGEGAGAPAAISVSEVTSRISRAIKAGVPGSVVVRGEISGFKIYGASGHAYFSLKDAENIISCVMWKAAFGGVKFRPEDGLEVLVTGAVDVFGKRGQYQLNCRRMEPVGQGALQLAYEQLYARLAAEGLFAAERKRPIPHYPGTVALVTSLSAAGFADMLKVFRKVPAVRVVVYPVPVQGDGAAARIAAALDHLGASAGDIGGVDVIIMGRGGGSYEDLFEFSREVVARAVARCPIPIVTGIGHEIDTAIADLVADYHAHTPTAAAEHVVQHWVAAKDHLANRRVLLNRTARESVRAFRQRFKDLADAEFFARPVERIDRLRQSLDTDAKTLRLSAADVVGRLRRRVESLSARLEEHNPRRRLEARRARLATIENRLTAVLAARINQAAHRIGGLQNRMAGALTTRLRQSEQRLNGLAMRLERRGPAVRLPLLRQRLEAADRRLTAAATADVDRRRTRLGHVETQLRLISPDNVLARGFTITTGPDGAVLRSAADARAAGTITTRFADGTVDSRIGDRPSTPTPPTLFDL